jgi:large subunit ribosomal protein L25
MEQVTLDVQVRNLKGSQRMKDLRKSGMIPAVVYGGDQQPMSVQVTRGQYERIMRQHSGESFIFHLQLSEGEKKLADFPALMRATQFDPVSDLIVHLDFLRIFMDKEISLRVPLILKGEAIGIKKPGATLEQLLREIEIFCLPKDVPQHIDVDVSGLDIHASVHVSDLKLPSGVRTKMDPGAAVAAVVFSTREAEATTAEGAATPELEVIKEKPKDDKAAAGAAKPAAGAAKPAAGAAKPAAKPEAKK